MNIEATATGYGTAALQLLGRQVAELKGNDPLAPVTILGASNYVALISRRGLAALPGGIINVHFGTLGSLAAKLGAIPLQEAGRRPTTTALITGAIRAALHEAPGLFAPVAEHPETAQALRSSYRELRQIPASAADAVAACSARASDVVRICRNAHSSLADEWYDDEDLLTAAIEQLREDPLPDFGPVIVHLLPHLSDTQADFVRLLSSRGPLKINVGLTGNPGADAPVRATYERAGITVTPTTDLSPPCASRIISASDPDDEVRAAVRLVMKWAQEGIRLGRVAVLYGNADPYARLVCSHLAGAAIPYTGMPVRSLADLLFGRALLALLSLPDRAFRRPDVLGLLADAPILDQGLATPTRAWERLSREAGVVSGDDWSQRLMLLASMKRRDAEKDDRDGHVSRAEGKRRQADQADALAVFVGRLQNDLAVGSDEQTWAGLVRWAKGLLRTYLGDEDSREGWPEEEQDSAARVEDALGVLAELDSLSGPRPNLKVFRQALATALSKPASQIGHLGGGVLVGHLSIASGLVFDRIIVLGMAEERFPPRRLEDSLLRDSERAAADGHLQLRTDRVHDDHRHLLAAISGASEAVLTWPRGDLRQSNDQPASRWLLDDAARLSGSTGIRSAELLKLRDQPWFDNIASFADGVARATAFPTDQDLRLAAIGRRELKSPILSEDTRLCRASAVVGERGSHAFTRFDGNLNDIGSDIPALQRVSATQLQTWATCPRRFLFKYLLRVNHIEEPEKQLRIDVLDRGTLFHAIMEQFISEAIESGHALNRWSQADRENLHRIARVHFTRFQREGRTGRELLWRREQSQILSELDRTLDRDNRRLAAGLRPVVVEHHFDLVEVAVPNGTVLHVNGSIDRIDKRLDGSLEIIDYKSGKHAGYTNLTEDTPHDGGKRLQLYLYALAGRQQFPEAPSVHAFYWFTKTDKLIGYPITEQVEQQVSAAIDIIVNGVESGVFPAHPSKSDPRGWVECWACTPDGLNSRQLRADWGRKRYDPLLATYAELAEPEVDE